MREIVGNNDFLREATDLIKNPQDFIVLRVFLIS